MNNVYKPNVTVQNNSGKEQATYKNDKYINITTHHATVGIAT